MGVTTKGFSSGKLAKTPAWRPCSQTASVFLWVLCLRAMKHFGAPWLRQEDYRFKTSLGSRHP